MNQLCRREYRKFFRRRPIRVLTEDGHDHPDYLPPAQPHEKQATKMPESMLGKWHTKQSVSDEVHLDTDEEYSDSDEDLRSDVGKQKRKHMTKSVNQKVPPYEKLVGNDSRFTKTLTLLKSRKQREKAGKILLEGRRLIIDAIAAGAVLETIFFSLKENLEGIPFHQVPNPEIFKVFYKQLSLWSDLTTCPGVMGVFKRPNYNHLAMTYESALPVTIICDNLRDPGNMGTVIRAAAAAGCQRILLTKGCIDMWESKVTRSACGAHFRIPILNDIPWEFLPNYISQGCAVYLADNREDLDNSEDSNKSKEAKVNTGVLSSKAGDKRWTKDVRSIISHIYTDVYYPGTESYLIVGGETEGLSAEALKLAADFGGIRVLVPIENGVESLNSAMALSIILFEMKRQYRVERLEDNKKVMQ